MADKKKKMSQRGSNHRPKKTGGAAKLLHHDETILYGIHAVKAALANENRRFIKILTTKNAADRLKPLLDKRGLSAEIVEAHTITALTGPDAVHQGMAALARPLDTHDIYDVQSARLLLVLDQITDPHNVGAIMRSAVALGVDAIVTTHRNAPKETGLLAKTASGGLDHITLVYVTNLAQALAKLSDFGFLTIGLDSEGENDLSDTLHGDKIALVLGAEGAGLRRLTRERCEVLARLDMPGPIKSLNVSNAAMLSTYIAVKHLNGNKGS